VFTWTPIDIATYKTWRERWGPVLQERCGLNYREINSYYTNTGQIGDIREAASSYMWFCNAGHALAQSVDIIVRVGWLDELGEC